MIEYNFCEELGCEGNMLLAQVNGHLRLMCDVCNATIELPLDISKKLREIGNNAFILSGGQFGYPELVIGILHANKKNRILNG